MHTCPLCSAHFHVRQLPHQSWWKNYRVCPSCGGRISVDSDTKIRQALFLLVALMSLGFTVMLQFDGPHWLLPAIVSYVVIGLALYRGTKKMFFVPYDSGRSDN
jgi:hypothetical protein